MLRLSWAVPASCSLSRPLDGSHWAQKPRRGAWVRSEYQSDLGEKVLQTSGCPSACKPSWARVLAADTLSRARLAPSDDRSHHMSSGLTVESRRPTGRGIVAVQCRSTETRQGGTAGQPCAHIPPRGSGRRVDIALGRLHVGVPFLQDMGRSVKARARRPWVFTLDRHRGWASPGPAPQCQPQPSRPHNVTQASSAAPLGLSFLVGACDSCSLLPCSAGRSVWCVRADRKSNV